MKFEVDEKLVEPIVRDHIAAAVTTALGDPTVLVRTMVNLALKQKVSSNGTVSGSSYDNKFDFIEAVAGNAIREAASKAIRQTVNEQAPLIQAAIESELRRSPKKTAAAIISAFCDTAKNQYRMTANFHFEAND